MAKRLYQIIAQIPPKGIYIFGIKRIYAKSPHQKSGSGFKPDL